MFSNRDKKNIQLLGENHDIHNGNEAKLASYKLPTSLPIKKLPTRFTARKIDDFLEKATFLMRGVFERCFFS